MSVRVVTNDGPDDAPDRIAGNIENSIRTAQSNSNIRLPNCIFMTILLPFLGIVMQSIYYV